MYGLAGPRYGAWSMMDVQEPTALGVGIGTAQSLADLSGTYARNNSINQNTGYNQQLDPMLLQAQQYKNQADANSLYQQNQLMPGQIAAAQQANQLGMKYAPGMAQAGYQGKLDDNSETAARTNYMNAQTGQMNQQPDPSGGFNALYQAYKMAPPGSPQQQYYGGLLNKMVATTVGGYLPSSGAPQTSTAQPIGTAPTSGVPTAPGQASAIGMPISNGTGTSPYTVNALTVGRGSSNGGQAAIGNPNGSSTVIEGPTTATRSLAQKRQIAHDEAGGLFGVYQQGINPYLGTQGALNYITDKTKAYLGDPDATDRLTGYSSAKKIAPELAQQINKFSAGQSSVEGTKQIQDSAFGNDWISLTPQAVAQKALANYFNTQTNAFNQSQIPEKTGFATNVNGPLNWTGGNQQPLFTDTINGNAPQNAAQISATKAAPQAGWQSDGSYRHSDGTVYTAAQLQAIAKGGK